MTKPLSAEEIATEQRIPVARALYLTWQPDFPKPSERTSRERLWNRDEVALYFRAGGVARC